MEDNKQPKAPKTPVKKFPVETLADDMAEAISADTGGDIKKIIHGEEELEAEKQNLSPESKRNRFFTYGGAALLFLAVILVAVFGGGRQPAAIPAGQEFAPLIFNDSSTYLETAGLKPIEIEQSILSEITKGKVKAGGIEGIYLTENKSVVGLREFISLLKLNFAPGENTVFVSDNFLTGYYKDAGTEPSSFFILLKTRSTSDIFGSLSSWENKMFADLHTLFGVKISSANSYLLTKDFSDGIIENKNARVLYDKDGNIMLMYIFANDNSVVITDTLSAAHEIISRLASSTTAQ